MVICSDNNEKIFSEINPDTYELSLTSVGEIIDGAINNLSNRPHQCVEKYVIMPNHLHILLFLDDIKTEKRP